MVQTILGARIRERRRQMGVTQAEMARRIGISASYLNLIERNKRRIAGALLQRTAQELGMQIEQLDGAEERRLVDELNEIAKAPGLSDLAPETTNSGEFVGRFPGWSRAAAALARSERAARDRVRALSERLNHDPFLGEAVHRMLTRIAAIRSSAEILDDYRDMSEQERARFDAIVLSEAKALSETGEALANYFDSSDAADRMLTPQDEVDALFTARGNRFEEIETAVRERGLGTTGGLASERIAKAGEHAETDLRHEISGILQNARQIQTAGGKSKAERALFAYAAGAILLPERPFAMLARSTGYDAEVIAAEFGTAVSAVLRRLSALSADDGHPRFGYLVANASGSLIDVNVPPGFTVPRYAPPCSLWILFAAQRTPGEMMRQRAVFGNGSEYLFVARAQALRQGAYGGRTHYSTEMLIIPQEEAEATVYGKEAELPPEDVGPACRLCARASCTYRVEDPLQG